MKVMLPLKVCDRHFRTAVDDTSHVFASISHRPKVGIPELAQRNFFYYGAAAVRLKAELAGILIVMSPLFD